MNNSPWQGRSDPSDNSRWHQVVEVTKKVEPDCHCIIGFNCDEGVRRNKGRTGAAAGPDQIRKMLSNLIYPGEKPIIDLGNIDCIENLLEDAQSNLASKIADVINAKSLPIILGGGHEIAWGTYQGIRQAHPTAKLGIINFDAHFDLRPVEPLPSSGTPFRQAAQYAEDKNINFDYLVYGINPSVNTEALFNYANEKNVHWKSDLSINNQPWQKSFEDIANFCESLDYLYITVCLDVFPASYAPGVSAPAALGVNPNIILQLIDSLKRQFASKILALEVAEMNPTFDIDDRTARLAARLIHQFTLPS
jgi:formiminoglutamase|tara:strand:+ start:41 stop:961 length:921 start_codon:yes stop_codon:yes gene_type:complete